jgi:hypothetical protein
VSGQNSFWRLVANGERKGEGQWFAARSAKNQGPWFDLGGLAGLSFACCV